MRKVKETISQVRRLMDEWDKEKNEEAGLNPEKLGFQSNKYAFWKCQCGYRWRAKISNRYNGRSCPCCARSSLPPSPHGRSDAPSASRTVSGSKFQVSS